MTRKDQVALLGWYDQARRDLPWRRTNDPYAIWVSEVMLQQTRVDVVIPYFERWMARFPAPADLAVADEQEVLSMWQGLGYYRRARNLHLGAKLVASGFPRDMAGIRELPGVGPYTSGAIASIALGLPEPLVDGNVERVFARLTACRAVPPTLTREAWGWAERVLVRERPGDWNQALMELGATVCTPTQPKCGVCPLESACQARSLGVQEALPVRTERPKPTKLTFYSWIAWHDGAFGLVQIPKGSWWEGMWEFPRTESSEPPLDLEGGWWEQLEPHRHAVTNHRITLHPNLGRLNHRPAELHWFSQDELTQLPMPSPQRKLLALARARV